MTAATTRWCTAVQLQVIFFIRLGSANLFAFFCVLHTSDYHLPLQKRGVRNGEMRRDLAVRRTRYKWIVPDVPRDPGGTRLVKSPASPGGLSLYSNEVMSFTPLTPLWTLTSSAENFPYTLSN